MHFRRSFFIFLIVQFQGGRKGRNGHGAPVGRYVRQRARGRGWRADHLRRGIFLFFHQIVTFSRRFS